MIYKPTDEEEAASDRFHAERMAKIEATAKAAAKSDAPMKLMLAPAPITPAPKDAETIIKLIDSQSAELTALREDAEKWRTLIGAARVRVMGSAGFGYAGREPDARGYRHVGIELWTTYNLANHTELAEKERADFMRHIEDFIKHARTLSTDTAPDKVG